MENLKIGWIGLGNMGSPMSKQLLLAGYPLTVYNRSKAKEEPLRKAGASIAPSPAKLIQDSAVAIIMVSDDKAIAQIFNAPDGLLSAKASGKIVVNMSTVSPGISRAMAAHCKEQGNHYLDAPVSGSVKQAETGELVIMAGGAAEIFEQVKPIFEKLGKMAVRVGDNGIGNQAKLAINALLAVHAQGLAETVLFAQQHQINTEDLLSLINNSALGNVFGKIKGEAINRDNYSAAFALKHLAKDLRLAKAEGLSAPLATAAFNTFREAEQKFGEEDVIAVMKQLKAL